MTPKTLPLRSARHPRGENEEDVRVLLSVRASDSRSTPRATFALVRFTLAELRELWSRMQECSKRGVVAFSPDSRVSFHRTTQSTALGPSAPRALRVTGFALAPRDFRQLTGDGDEVTHRTRVVAGVRPTAGVCWNGIERATQLDIETVPLPREFLQALIGRLTQRSSRAASPKRDAA